MSGTLIDFYKVARLDETVVATLSPITDADDFAAKAVMLAQERGFTITVEEAKQGMANFESLMETAANDDELTEFELELVAAGFPINCSSGATPMQ